MSRKENKDINPFLLKFGVALAVSFAGFLFSRLRIKSRRPSLPPPPSSPSDANYQVIRCRSEISDDIHAKPRTPISDAQDKDTVFLRVRIENGSSNSSPSTNGSDRDRYLLPEFNELVKGIDMSSPSKLRETETPSSSQGAPKGTNHVERDEYEQELGSLKAMLRDLRERERGLEMQLLEYYGLKEQETTVNELKNRLKINNVEAKFFSLKIEGLQAENKRLTAQVAEYSRVVAELEAAKAQIKELKKKLRSDAEERKEQILKLKQRVLMLKLQEKDPHMAGSSETIEPDLLEKLQRLEDLESEREELRKSKYELQRQNSELARRLDSTQMLATSMFENPEVEEMHREVIRLREENNNLSKVVEGLQSDRCADAEALVYLKWVNACLRYELRNYKPPPGKTVARDLSKTLSPKSEAKAKELILEYANNTEEKHEYDQWSSSQSFLTDSGDPDELLYDASSGNKAHHSKKLKFFDKLRRLITGKDKDEHTTTSHNKNSSEDLQKMFITRRNSTSILSQNSIRSSLDLNRAFSLSPENTKFMGSMKRSMNSTRASAEPELSPENAEIMRMNRSRSCKTLVLGGEASGSISPLDTQVDKGAGSSSYKPDVVRYAEALKDSSRTRKTHRKSASYY